MPEIERSRRADFNARALLQAEDADQKPAIGLLMRLAKGLVGAVFVCAPVMAADLRILHSDNDYVLFTDLDARRADPSGLWHGVTFRVSATPLPNSGAEVSRFEDVADCASRQISTERITGYDRDLELVQRLTPPLRWAVPGEDTQSEFDALCDLNGGGAEFRRLPIRDWKVAAIRFLSHLRRLHASS